MIYPNSLLTYNERHQKIIVLIDWTLEKYKAAVTNIKKMKQKEVIIDNIIEELDKKRYSYKQKAKNFSIR